MVSVLPARSRKSGTARSSGRPSRTAREADAGGCSQPLRLSGNTEVAKRKRDRSRNAFSAYWSDQDEKVQARKLGPRSKYRTRPGPYPGCDAGVRHANTHSGTGTGRGSAAEAGDGYLADVQRRLFGSTLQHAGPDQCEKHRFAHTGLGISDARECAEIDSTGSERNSVSVGARQCLGRGCALWPGNLAVRAAIG